MEFFSNLHFDKSVYLFGLLFLPFIFLIPLKQKTSNISKYYQFAELRFLKLLQITKLSKGNLFKLKILLCLISALLIVSLSGLRGKHREVEVFSSQEKLVIVIDLSLSMNVEDIYPSRLKYVKTELAEALTHSKITPEIALVGFANIPYLLYPFTNDYETSQEIIQNLSTDIINIQGSNIEPALLQASSMLDKFPVTRKNILLITDGSYEIPDFSVMQKLSKDNLNLHIVAVGTEEGGPVINKQGKFLKDDSTNSISRLKPSKLSDLRNIFNAKLHIIDNNDFNFPALLEGIFSTDSESEEQSGTIKIWQEYSFIPTLIAMLFILPLFRKGLLLITLCLLFMPGENAKAGILLNKNQEALENYNKKNYVDAEKLFLEYYNKGVSAYRNGDYENAAKYFSNGDKDEKSLLNLGNSNLLLNKIKEAITNYEDIIKTNPNNDKATKNLKIAKKLLKDRQEKQQKEEDENNKEKNDNKEDQDSDNSKNDPNDKTQDSDKSDNNEQDDSDSNEDMKNKDENEPDPNEDSKDAPSRSDQSKGDKTPSKSIEDNILDMIDSGTDKMLGNKVRKQDKTNTKNFTQVRPW